MATQINLLRQVKNLNFPEWFLINWQIVTSVNSWNLTVAIKTLAWTDPSTTDPVYCRIDWVVRAITSALTQTFNAGINYLNLWSSELATKEVDLFFSLTWDITSNWIDYLITRRPIFYTQSEISWNNTVENWVMWSSWLNNNPTNKVVNIWRFNVILSAWHGYTWSIPATSVIINRPIFETRKLEYVPQFSNSILSWYDNAYYQIISNRMYVWFNADNKTFSSWSWSANISLPFSPNEVIPKIIYTLGNSSTRPNNTYMTQIQDWKIKFYQWSDFTWFDWTETSIFLKFDDTLLI